MAKLKIYSYDKCSTCRKALKFLDSKEVDYETVDITERPPTLSELKSVLASYDGEIKKLFNTSGVQYRELGISEKLKGMTESEALKLLAGNGRLVKRPFVVASQRGLVGFDETLWKKTFR
ncbi:MAG: arsenate reductase family protein [Bdellovibrionaceae bacterium]|nr:arsenate reductase family protein [Pseudobdellovibrionaceae bacterium]MBX3041322.1 arsenate reductase family protein [Pseudobdellovibrionaceae bacterium]